MIPGASRRSRRSRSDLIAGTRFARFANEIAGTRFARFANEIGPEPNAQQPLRICPSCLRTDHSHTLDRCPDDGAALLPLESPAVPLLRGQALRERHDGPALGTLFADKFVLLGVLGVGGSGTVYRAVQRPLGREVALKVLALPPELAAPGTDLGRELQARFQREAAVLAHLRSPHVVGIFDAGETADGTSWLAMERAAGEPLDQLLQAAPGGRFTAARVLALGRLLATALRDIHAHGIVHRDVKPANILVGADADALTLVDFGIARALADHAAGSAARLTRTGIVLGSLAYMAPEQLSSQAAAAVGPAADVYAAGVTLFEAATGQLPYPGPSAPAYAMQHREAPIPDSSKLAGAHGDRSVLGRALAAVVKRCLAKEPSDRYADGAALLQALEQAADPAVLATRAADVRARLAQGGDENRHEEAPQRAARTTRHPLRPGRVLRWVALGLGAAVFVWGLVEGR